MASENRPQLPGGDGFRKKSFTPRTFVGGAVRALRNGPALLRAHRADRVSSGFAEKIMLATTAVNDCRYCARFHTYRARSDGVDREVIDAILEQDVDDAVATHERPALLFAQYYAETDGNPDAEAVTELESTYGPAMATDIQAYVRAIYFANLLGNSVDAVRYRLRAAADGWLAALQHSTQGDDR